MAYEEAYEGAAGLFKCGIAMVGDMLPLRLTLLVAISACPTVLEVTKTSAATAK